MNKFTLQLRVKQSEGALVRILGVTRRRRFDLLHLTADTIRGRALSGRADDRAGRSRRKYAGAADREA